MSYQVLSDDSNSGLLTFVPRKGLFWKPGYDELGGDGHCINKSCFRLMKVDYAIRRVLQVNVIGGVLHICMFCEARDGSYRIISAACHQNSRVMVVPRYDDNMIVGSGIVKRGVSIGELDYEIDIMSAFFEDDTVFVETKSVNSSIVLKMPLHKCSAEYEIDEVEWSVVSFDPMKSGGVSGVAQDIVFVNDLNGGNCVVFVKWHNNHYALLDSDGTLIMYTPYAPHGRYAFTCMDRGGGGGGSSGGLNGGSGPTHILVRVDGVYSFFRLTVHIPDMICGVSYLKSADHCFLHLTSINANRMLSIRRFETSLNKKVIVAATNRDALVFDCETFELLQHGRNITHTLLNNPSSGSKRISCVEVPGGFAISCVSDNTVTVGMFALGEDYVRLTSTASATNKSIIAKNCSKLVRVDDDISVGPVVIPNLQEAYLVAGVDKSVMSLTPADKVIMAQTGTKLAVSWDGGNSWEKIAENVTRVVFIDDKIHCIAFVRIPTPPEVAETEHIPYGSKPALWWKVLYVHAIPGKNKVSVVELSNTTIPVTEIDTAYTKGETWIISAGDFLNNNPNVVAFYKVVDGQLDLYSTCPKRGRIEHLRAERDLISWVETNQIHHNNATVIGTSSDVSCGEITSANDDGIIVMPESSNFKGIHMNWIAALKKDGKYSYVVELKNTRMNGPAIPVWIWKDANTPESAAPYNVVHTLIPANGNHSIRLGTIDGNIISAKGKLRAKNFIDYAQRWYIRIGGGTGLTLWNTFGNNVNLSVLKKCIYSVTDYKFTGAKATTQTNHSTSKLYCAMWKDEEWKHHSAALDARIKCVAPINIVASVNMSVSRTRAV